MTAPARDSEETASPADVGDTGLRRRRRVLMAVVAGAVLLSAAGVGAATLVKSPQEVAASAGPPAPDVLTATVERRVLKDSVVLRGTVAAAQSVDVTALAGGADTARAVVTKTPLAVGRAFGAGKVLLEVSGRPVFALPGALPVYRDLKPGSEGQDVRQLQRALAGLGHATGGDEAGTFGPGTQEALSSFYTSIGYDAPPATADGGAALTAAEDAVRAARRAREDARRAEGPDAAWQRDRAQEDLDLAKERLAEARIASGPMLPAAEVVYLRGFPGRVDALDVAVGSQPTAKLMTVSAGELVVTGLLDPAQKGLIRAGQKVRILAEATGAEASATVASVSDTAVQTGGGAGGDDGSGSEAGEAVGKHRMVVRPDKALPTALAGQDVRLTVEAASSAGPVLVVPDSAVSAGADGRTTVTVLGPADRRTRIEVRTGTSGDGYVQVTPVGGGPGLRAGDRVVIGVRTGAAGGGPAAGSGSGPGSGASAGSTAGSGSETTAN
ncbi:peptidoglycan-binding protein [Streptomyces sp. NPDC004284]|uniref:peptidoglycan-binding protein n=1 Tax=Streptomyces sp. NPDC004284 TaxID=3364695 RepID=UPI0036A59628